MKIVDAINKIFDVVSTVKKATGEDSPGGKKVTLAEGIGIGISAIGIIPAFTAINQLTDDWKTRDAVKKAEWIGAFSERFDLPNDELESQIENLVAAVLSLEGSFGNLSTASKE